MLSGSPVAKDQTRWKKILTGDVEHNVLTELERRVRGVYNWENQLLEGLKLWL